MFSLTINTNSGRFSKIINVNSTVADVLSENSISTQNANVSLNGRMVTDLYQTFDDLGISEGANAVLSVVVKVDSAR